MSSSTEVWRRALLAFALALVPLVSQGGETVTLMHVHGLAYSADGRQLMIPSHRGLAVYAQGRWSKAPGPAHDYMGFSASRDALYSSGHPAPGSGLVNPFGLIRSRDGGKSWQKLGLEGESDFHLLAASYGTHAVYVLNEEPNSRMREPGFHYTVDDGVKWQRGAAEGLRSKVAALAVHPTDARIVAAGAADGLYLSRDGAQRFEPLEQGTRVLGVQFDLDGRHLWFSTYANRPGLARVALAPGAKPQAMTLPPLREDAVAYIAQNPARPRELAIATFRRSVFVSADGGASWKQIASEGTARDG